MRFLFVCSKRLAHDVASSVCFNDGGWATRRVLGLRRSTPAVPHRVFASTLSRLVTNSALLNVGGSGSVKLDILRPSTRDSQSVSNAIIYLPSGPVFSSETSELSVSSRQNIENEDETTPQEILARITGSTIITINYRLGYSHESPVNNSDARILYKYPVPVHDTLAGFDWVLNTLRPERLGVTGSNIGGSLALMLALTEFKNIRGIAAFEPICDWTGLDEFCTIDPKAFEEAFKSKDTGAATEQDVEKELLQAQIAQIKQNSRRRKKIAPPDLVPLLEARERLFQTPSKYFDPFASPILFLRSAGKDVPNAFPKYLTGPEYPTPVLQKPSIDDDLVDLWDIYIQSNTDENYPSTEANTGDERPTRRRKALSRWPPFGIDFSTDKVVEAKLPWVKILARTDEGLSSPTPVAQADNSPIVPEGDVPLKKRRSRARDGAGDSVLATQAKEMVSVMHRACFWGREKSYGEQRVTLNRLPRNSISTDNAGKPNDPQAAAMYETGFWFKDMLCREKDDDE